MKRIVLSAIICGFAFTLNGCVSTNLRSMGSMPMQTMHQPRLAPENKDAQVAVTVDGFGLIGNTWYNTEEIYGAGGLVNGIYRFGNTLSPLFVSATVGGLGGNLRFNCKGKHDCSSEFHEWLLNDDANKDYDFWAIQERLVAGAEFNFGKWLFLEIGGGFQMFQSGGSFDDTRDEMEDALDINNKDDGFDISYFADLQIGHHLGQNGHYGTIAVEAMFSGFYVDSDKTRIPISLGYFHPTGFHGGAIFTTDAGVSVFAGKTFTF